MNEKYVFFQIKYLVPLYMKVMRANGQKISRKLSKHSVLRDKISFKAELCLVLLGLTGQFWIKLKAGLAACI